MQQHSSLVMKRTILHIILFTLTLTLLLFYGTRLIPSDLYRTQLTQLLSDITGRNVTIKGDIAFSIFPWLALDLHDVSIHHDADPNMLLMQASYLSLGIHIFPFIQSQHFDISHLRAHDFHINIYVDDTGTTHWPWAPITPKPVSPSVQPTTTSPPATSLHNTIVELSDIYVGEIDIQQGHVTYNNAHTAKQFTLDNIDIALEDYSFASPLSLEATTDWQGRTIQLTIAADAPSAFLSSDRSALALTLTAPNASLEYQGNMLRAEDTMTLEGNLHSTINALPDVVSWISNSESSLLPRKVQFSSKILLNPQKLHLQHIKSSIDHTSFTGDLAVDLHTTPLKLTGTIAADRIDLSPLVTDTASTPKTMSSSTFPQSSTDKTIPWSTTPITTTWLTHTDADIALTWNKLTLNSWHIDQSTLQLSLHDAKLVGTIEAMQFYNGTISGNFHIGQSPTKTLHVNQQLQYRNIDLGMLMKEQFPLAKLGKGFLNSNIELRSEGNHMHALVQQLQGKGDFAINEGSFKGLNFSFLKSFFKNGLTANALQHLKESKTSHFAGTMAIDKGVIHSKDLRIDSSLAHINGSGKIDIGNWKINYLVLVTPGNKTTAIAGDLGIGIPTRIVGPLHKPLIVPDPTGVVAVGKNLIHNAPKTLKTLPKNIENIPQFGLEILQNTLKKTLPNTQQPPTDKAP